ncbi:Lsr2 family protein [Streptomyces sp. NBC_00727]|uniref:Lsr2 family DNA-binding protein n=1 Tax=Streptomyces sp. NBC_00727 TaxID=2903675 RepID=UPI00386A2369
MDEQQRQPDVRGAQPQGDDAVRVWARANGYVVNERGRIPAMIREACAKEQPRTAD